MELVTKLLEMKNSRQRRNHEQHEAEAPQQTQDGALHQLLVHQHQQLQLLREAAVSSTSWPRFGMSPSPCGGSSLQMGTDSSSTSRTLSPSPLAYTAVPQSPGAAVSMLSSSIGCGIGVKSLQLGHGQGAMLAAFGGGSRSATPASSFDLNCTLPLRSATGQPKKRPLSPMRACVQCWQSKMKCDGQQPCGRCQMRGISEQCARQQRKAGTGVVDGLSSDAAPPRAKRKIIKHGLACMQCRRSKVKCDGDRPCAKCMLRGLSETCSSSREEPADSAVAQQSAGHDGAGAAQQQHQPHARAHTEARQLRLTHGDAGRRLSPSALDSSLSLVVAHRLPHAPSLPGVPGRLAATDITDMSRARMLVGASVEGGRVAGACSHMSDEGGSLPHSEAHQASGECVCLCVCYVCVFCVCMCVC